LCGMGGHRCSRLSERQESELEAHGKLNSRGV
jgi:hypothetical protein